MRITRETFEEFYPQISMDGYTDIFYTKPKNKKDFLTNYLSSKLWRMNNLYTVINKSGQEEIFRMNYAQHLTYSSAMVHPRIIVLKSRQQGISTLWLISYFDDALFNKNTSVGLMAQGLDESEKLLERIKTLWTHLDQDVLNFLNVRKRKENSKEFAFSNNSTIFVRTSFRSATLQRLHISEFGKIANANPARAKETKTGTLQTIAAGNNVTIESTAEGINDFKTMWDTAVSYEQSGEPLAPKDFKPVFLSWVNDPDCTLSIKQSISQSQLKYFEELEETLSITLTQEQKNFWVSQYRELGEEIYQEYPATPEEAFRKVKDGTYYSRLYRLWVANKGRERSNLYDPNLPVLAAFDLGIDDCTFIIFYQLYRGEIRFIDEFFDVGQDVAYYCDKMISTGYNITNVELPWDAETRCLQTGDTVLDSFEDFYREAIHRGVIKQGSAPIFNVQDKNGFYDGVENVRKMIRKLYIDKCCIETINAFLSYSKKWDEKNSIWLNKEPKHDQHSHPADTARYIANTLPSSFLNYVFGDQVKETKDTSVIDGMAI